MWSEDAKAYGSISVQKGVSNRGNGKKDKEVKGKEKTKTANCDFLAVYDDKGKKYSMYVEKDGGGMCLMCMRMFTLLRMMTNPSLMCQ